MTRMLERWVLRRVAGRVERRMPYLDKKKLMEALAVPEGSPLLVAVMNVALGREQEAREMCSVRGQSNEDLRFNSGKLNDAIEFQEELIALVRKANGQTK